MKHRFKHACNRISDACEGVVLFSRTIRDVLPSQIGARAILVTKRHARRWLRTTVPDSCITDAKPLPIHVNPLLDATEGSVQRADDAMRGVFRFLEREVRFGETINWQHDGESHLWRFNLNYCAITLDFARAFRITGRPIYECALKTHIGAWIRANRVMTGDPWSPYTASLRVVNWIVSCSAVWDELSCHAAFVDELTTSVLAHMNFIRSNLEYDVRCNHLLENVKALIVGGVFLQSKGLGAPYFELGKKMLLEQLDEQVLSDGGHCERSLMYHCVMLEGFLVICEALRRANEEVPPKLSDAILRMSQFLWGLTQPNGSIPLLNDSVEDGALHPAVLIRWANNVLGLAMTPPNQHVHYDSSGYIRSESPSGDVLVFDCGEPCPKYQPGHAHADTLSIVWTLADGSAILVDPGVYEYTAGPWRHYFRGTRAHNTVQLDGQDSTEVWASFRAARKAEVTCSGIEQLANGVHLFGEHDGYVRLNGKPLHRRDVYLLYSNIIVVLDTISGSGTHLLESRQHFHPACDVAVESGSQCSVRIGRHSVQLRFLTEGKLSCARGSVDPILGWYAPSFGRKEPCPCTVWEKRVKLPYRTGFVLAGHGAPVLPTPEVGRITLPLGSAGTLEEIVLGQL